MFIDPEHVKMFCVAAYGALPFALGAIASWLNARNVHSKYVIPVAVMFAICGVFAAFAIFSKLRVSKYPATDFIFGGVLVLSFASAGAIIGAAIDRIRFGGVSRLRRRN